MLREFGFQLSGVSYQENTDSRDALQIAKADSPTVN
jgi:hypothetical protein